MDRSSKPKAGASQFRKHLRKSINVDDVEIMAKMLEKELSDTLNTVSQITSLVASMSGVKFTPMDDLELDSDAVSKFLEAEALKLVSPDLVNTEFAGDVDVILATMKKYADYLKKNLPTIETRSMNETNLNWEPIDINQYAFSLEQLNSRLAYIRHNMRHEEKKKDLNMEKKLETLDENIKLFKTLTEGNSLLSKASTGGSAGPGCQDLISQYEEIINKLLSGINDVTYLRQNKG